MVHSFKMTTAVVALFVIAVASAAPAKQSTARASHLLASPTAKRIADVAWKGRPSKWILPSRWILPTSERHHIVSGDLARSLAVADLLHDGTVDVVVGNELNLSVGVMLSDHRGQLSDIVRYPVASAEEVTLYSVQVAVGNLIGKQYPDIVAGGFSRDTLKLLRGKSLGRFAAPIEVALGDGEEPISVAIADLNEDRRQDIAASRGLDQRVTVLFGNGRGGFSSPVHIPTPAFAGRIAIADATGDGRLDILSAGLDAGVSLLPGRGEGKFAPARLLTAAPGTIVLGLAAADATGDGLLDVITANQTDGFDPNLPGSVSILAGLGRGQFTIAKRLSVGEHTLGRAESVAVGDLTGDGVADIVAGRAVGGILTLLPGDGAGGFAEPLDIAGAGESPDPVVIADITGDRRPDIIASAAIGGYAHEMVAILPTDGSGVPGRGNFNARLRINAEAMVVARFNRDSHPDIATVGLTPDWQVRVAVQLGEASALAPPQHYDVDLTSGNGITHADANGDGRTDLFVVGRKGAKNIVAVLLGDGVGAFSGPHHFEFALDSQAPHAIAAADLDGDGRVDIATSNIPFACFPGDPNCSPPDLGSASILLNDGQGGFGRQIQIEDVADSPFWITAADATGDGKVDLVLPHMDPDDPGVRLLTGDGSGGFVDPMHLATDMGPIKVIAVDATGDKQIDLITLNHTAQSVSVLAGDGTGGFDSAAHYPMQLDQDITNCAPDCPWLWPWAWSLAVGDLDGNGAPDIATANTGNGTITILRNNGRDAYSAVERSHTGGSPRAMTLADLTGDSKLDVVVASMEGIISVHANARKAPMPVRCLRPNTTC